MALSTLEMLASEEANVRDLQQYVIFIRGILDYSERLSVSDTSVLLDILCRLACGENESSSMNELFIVVRKYLGMSDNVHRRMGVLGCCSILQHYRGDMDSVESLFHFCLKSSRNFPEIRLFFYERLVCSLESGCLRSEVVEVCVVMCEGVVCAERDGEHSGQGLCDGCGGRDFLEDIASSRDGIQSSGRSR